MPIVLNGSTGITIPTDPTTALGVASKQYSDAIGLSESFRGLVLRTSTDFSNANTQVVLVRADEIVVSDGLRATRVTPTSMLTCNTGIIGAGGMETTRANSSWNRLYYIRKSSDGTEALFASRGKDYLLDAAYTAVNDTTTILRQATGTAGQKLAQSFQVAVAGNLEMIDVTVSYASSRPVGNYWFTIEADSAGRPSGTPLATSDKYDCQRVPANFLIRLPFRTPATLATVTTYHLVMQGDYTASDTVAAAWRSGAAGGYASGKAQTYNGSVWADIGTADFLFKVYITRNDAVPVLPSGYDQKCQIGWFYIDSVGNNKRFIQTNRQVATDIQTSWQVGSITALMVMTDVSTWFPPQMVFGSFGVRSSGTNYTCWGLLSTTDLNPTNVENVSGQYNVFTVAAAVAAGIGLGPHMVPIEYQGSVLGVSTSTSEIYSLGFTW